jgi:hypothetical protein
MNTPSQVARSTMHPHYWMKYQKLYEYLNSYNGILYYKGFLLDAKGEAVIYMKTIQPDLLEELLDLSGQEWVRFRREDGVIAWLDEQNITQIRIPKEIKRIQPVQTTPLKEARQSFIDSVKAMNTYH